MIDFYAMKLLKECLDQSEEFLEPHCKKSLCRLI